MVSICSWSVNIRALKCLDQWVIGSVLHPLTLGSWFWDSSQSLDTSRVYWIILIVFSGFYVMPVAMRLNTQIMKKYCFLQPGHFIQNSYISASSLIPRSFAFSLIRGFIKNPLWPKDLGIILTLVLQCASLTKSQSAPHHNCLSVSRPEITLLYYDYALDFIIYYTYCFLFICFLKWWIQLCSWCAFLFEFTKRTWDVR